MSRLLLLANLIATKVAVGQVVANLDLARDAVQIRKQQASAKTEEMKYRLDLRYQICAESIELNPTLIIIFRFKRMLQFFRRVWLDREQSALAGDSSSHMGRQKDAWPPTLKWIRMLLQIDVRTVMQSVNACMLCLWPLARTGARINRWFRGEVQCNQWADSPVQ